MEKKELSDFWRAKLSVNNHHIIRTVFEYNVYDDSTLKRGGFSYLMRDALDSQRDFIESMYEKDRPGTTSLGKTIHKDYVFTFIKVFLGDERAEYHFKYSKWDFNIKKIMLINEEDSDEEYETVWE